jgi:hypothetical protein
LSPQQELDLAREIRDILGSNAEHSYASNFLFELPATIIEQWLHDGGAPYGIVPGPDHLGVTTADCMPITCGGKKLCLGTDKIGHFFQQGYMGHELVEAGLGGFVQSFFEWTEGLSISNKNDTTLIWLKNGEFNFYGFDENRIGRYQGMWGPAQHSKADVQANLGGMEFYSQMQEFCGCIMTHISGEHLPDLDKTKCFNICDYITGAWEE